MLTVSAAGPWSGAWGGREGVSVFTPPAAGLWLTVGKPGAAPLDGMLLVKSLTGVSDTPPEKSLAGKPFRESAIGWSLAGEWLPQYEGAELKLAAVPGENAVPALLTLGRTAGRPRRGNPVPARPEGWRACSPLEACIPLRRQSAERDAHPGSGSKPKTVPPRNSRRASPDGRPRRGRPLRRTVAASVRPGPEPASTSTMRRSRKVRLRAGTRGRGCSMKSRRAATNTSATA